MNIVERGDIALVNFEPVNGSEQGGIRPAVIVQNDISNKNSPTTIVVPITSKRQTRTYVTNVPILAGKFSLERDSLILCNQIRTIDKRRLIKKISSLDFKTIKEVDKAIKISLNLD